MNQSEFKPILKMETSPVTIRLSAENDLPEYSSMLQDVYVHTYSSPGLGLTPDLFSKEIFATADTQRYLLSNLVNSETQKTFLAFLGSKLVGAITVMGTGGECGVALLTNSPMHPEILVSL